MKPNLIIWAAVLGLVFSSARADDTLSISYPASKTPGEFQVDAAYHIWIPPSTPRIRAIIVHQHGCGEGAEKSGETAALDLHWRALARRHDAALLSPHYSAHEQDCRLWCNPNNGSDARFQKALADLADKSRHPELKAAPWCLWGHSGGGFWASLMLEKHPEKIVAIFCRSGAATTAWEKGEIPKPEYPPAAFSVPIILNPGIKEQDGQFKGAWTTTTHFFELFQPKGAPIAFAPDPFSSHDCRNSRLLAIPFFDACLRLRLSEDSGPLKTLDRTAGFFGNWQTGEIIPVGKTSRPNTNSWLPDERSAKAFAQYVKTGVTTDPTPPESAPVITKAVHNGEGSVLLEWTAQADFESGIKQFAIYRDSQLLAKVPAEPNEKAGFAQFQGISYHDTPMPNVPQMAFTDSHAPAGADPSYAVSIINGAGLEGPKSKPVTGSH